jgi:hypothetical protein
MVNISALYQALDSLELGKLEDAANYIMQSGATNVTLSLSYLEELISRIEESGDYTNDPVAVEVIKCTSCGGL